MNQLYSIVRRVRRPLIAVDAPPVVVGDVEPVQVNAEQEAQDAEPQSEPAEAGSSNTVDAEAAT